MISPDFGRVPWALRLYFWLTARSPVLAWMARRAHRRQGADPARWPERLGQASLPRPPGKLIWLHAASVGEVHSIHALAKDLAANTQARILITTTTATGAKTALKTGPDDRIHQFMPLDSPGAGQRFLDHWHPDLAIFVEGDLWPRLIRSIHARGVPLVLLNARSSRSRRKSPRIAAWILRHFTLITAQDDSVQAALQSLDLPAKIMATGDLKASADLLPHDPAELLVLQNMIGPRPVWVAASTHAADEAPVLAAHRVARKTIPDLLLILIPRHPNRADAIRRLATDETIAQRSLNAPVLPQTTVLLADTLGETGLFYRVAGLVFLGGSFGPQGGHNPYEPAALGAGVLHGPNVAHFAGAYRAMRHCGAAREINDGPQLGDAVIRLTGTAALAAMQEAAVQFMADQSGALRRTVDLLLPLIGAGQDTPDARKSPLVPR